jgi:D-inositol-3-phosphate glycosyltransferase
LARIGYEVDIFTRKDSPIQTEIYEWQPGVRVIHVPAGPAEYIPKEELFPYMEEFSHYIMSFCIDESYDLIHANFWMSGWVALEVKRMLDVPFVITFHALGKIRRLYQKESDKFPFERIRIEEDIIREADGIIAECPQDCADMIELYQADKIKIVIIPCGIDSWEFQPIPKQIARIKLGLPLEDKIILQLGRIVPRKGVDTVIHALGHLSKHFGIISKLLIVGGNTDKPDPVITPEIGRLLSVAKEEKVSSQVEFTGNRPRSLLKFYYSAADVFVTTPWYEPFGITPLEAMACGTPVVGSNVGGIKFTVQDNVTGFLVPPQDPMALAERLKIILNNEEKAYLFKKESIKRAREFTWSNVASSVNDLYQRVCLRNYVSSDLFG